MIEIRKVSHGFDAGPVLRGISLSLTERRIAIIGANGSGKTTLARMLNGLVAPDRGEVVVDGHSAARDGPAVRRLVGYVFQNPEHQMSHHFGRPAHSNLTGAKLILQTRVHTLNHRSFLVAILLARFPV